MPAYLGSDWITAAATAATAGLMLLTFLQQRQAARIEVETSLSWTGNALLRVRILGRTPNRAPVRLVRVSVRAPKGLAINTAPALRVGTIGHSGEDPSPTFEMPFRDSIDLDRPFGFDAIWSPGTDYGLTLFVDPSSWPSDNPGARSITIDLITSARRLSMRQRRVTVTSTLSEPIMMKMLDAAKHHA